MKKRAVVICPGRGSYTKETLGYLRQFDQSAPAVQFMQRMDQRRKEANEPSITDMDRAAVFQPQLHLPGENASSLILTCALLDYMAIDREKFEVVAVTGNSMGWYLTVAAAGALDEAGAFAVVDTMGGMMRDQVIGGQVIYPTCDDDWRASPERRALAEEALTQLNSVDGVEVFRSIELGGYVVFGANSAGVSALLKKMPRVEHYPFQLLHHAAFHTPLLRQTSARAFAEIPMRLFRKPQLPMIDGRGQIWSPFSTSVEDLYHYTLGTQVVETYDFTGAVTVALKEFAPDCLILLGPGGSLGAPVGQILIANDWQNLKNKAQFVERQAQQPFVLAMGRPDQRRSVLI